MPLVLCLSVAAADAFGQSDSPRATEASPWNLESLSEAPHVKWIDKTGPIRSLTYQGERYKGRPSEVFAFYATPGTVAGDPSRDRRLPAVVLVHGGGGTAFAEWVWLWAKRGYAAIAMDLSGRRPERPKFKSGQLLRDRRISSEPLQSGGPQQSPANKFSTVGGKVNDDWPYHAVASVILAHSLVRSFPEVDAEQTALTGISWGGYTTCLAASIDHRFKAAVPVYGCGFLFEGESRQKGFIDGLPPERRALWIKMYDPSSHLAKCRVPMLFVNGTHDVHYPLDSYSRSVDLVPAPRQIRLTVRMRHSHRAGWKLKEIGMFIDHHLQGAKPLADLGAPRVEGDRIVVPYKAAVALQSATLHCTTDDGLLADRKWTDHPAQITKNQIAADRTPIRDATIWLITATDQRGATVSTNAVFVKTNE